MSAKVFIDGEVGTTGLKILERLSKRDDLELIRLDERKRKDPDARKDALISADVGILCLPDDAARQAASFVHGHATRLIDASTAHRIADGWVYGFAEMTKGHADQVKNARFVSNPGCYPTGAIALIRPLRERNILASGQLVSVNALSGYSGGGKSLIAEFEGASDPKAFVYGLAQTHKHLPELQQHGLLDRAPIFVPSVGAFAQGMIVQIPLDLTSLAGQPRLQDIQEILFEHYDGSHFVDVEPSIADPGRIDPQSLNGTNKMRLLVAGSQERKQVILTAVLDNLGKGASGAAVQNLNLMIGVPEQTGL